MKKTSTAFAIIAFAVGLIASSFTTKMSPLNARVWFDETQGFTFAVYGDGQAILNYFGMMSPGSDVRIAVGYNASRLGTAPSVDPFSFVTYSGNIIVDAGIKLGFFGQPTGAALMIDEELFQ